MAPLWQMYVGQGISPKTGALDAASGVSSAIERRRRLLQFAISQGRVSPDNLSRSDAAIAGLNLPHARQGGTDVFKGITGFFGNLLGEKGLYGVATHLPGGIYQTGKALVEDIGHGQWEPNRGQGHDSQIKEKIVQPTVQGFKHDARALGELAIGRPKEFYEAPLNPLLDVASVFSGGATLAGKTGGVLARSQALRVGNEGITVGGRLGDIGQKLSRITSTEGRAPTITGLPRNFSSSPNMKAAQILSDRFVLGRVGQRLNLPARQEERVLNRMIDVKSGERTQIAAHTIDKFSRPIVRTFNEMSNPERLATILSWRGINSPQLVAQFRAQLESSLKKAHDARMGHEVEGPHIGEFERDLVKPAAAEVQLRYLEDPEVVALLSQPTQAMRNADQAWTTYVEGRHEVLGIDPEGHQKHVQELHNHLLESIDEPVISDQAIAPTYFPARAARDFEFQQSRLERLRGNEPYFGRNKLDQTTRRGKLRPDEPLRNPIRPYMHDSTLDTVLSGAARMDPKVLIEHVKQVENDLLMSSFNHNMLEKLGFKGEDGVQSFTDTSHMNEVLAKKMNEARTWGDPNWRQWDPRNWVLIHPDAAIRWFRARHNAADEVTRILGDSPDAAMVERLLSDRAHEFWKTEVGAAKNPGFAIPRSAYDRIRANLEVNRPYDSKWVNRYAEGLNRWRTATLAAMPRWLVNTAVGSTVLALIKGNFNPRNYLQAAQLTKADKLPARVRLGGVVHGEGLEAGSRVGTARFPLTQASFKVVQSVEDFFRTAGFVQSLEKAAKQKMAETGHIIDFYKPFYNKDRGAYLDNLIQSHPDLVEKAIDDVDKFAYNFTSLSPNERRYVRLFVPFWGWYKFISKFAYRLPVEFPGRTRAMSAVSEIGRTFEEDQGPIPAWIKGSIILGKDKDGVVRYIPTLGLNPLSQFLNPFGGEGKVGGVLRLGQLNPAAQAVLSGLGINTMDAGEVPIGPQEGIGADFMGRLTNAQTGESTTAGEHGGLRRFIHSLLTSIPQVRIAELAATGGRPVYPESIPLIDERPMPVQPESRRNVEPAGILNQYFGAQPRQYNLRKYQEQLPKRAEYVKKRLQREQRLIRSRE